MKMFDIFLYLTIFNFMVTILVVVPVYSETDLQPGSGIEIYSDWEGLGGTAAAKPSVTDTLYMATIGAATAVLAVLHAILNATVLLPYFLHNMLHLPVSNPLIMMFTSLVWINYGIGAMQIWRNFSIRHAE